MGIAFHARQLLISFTPSLGCDLLCFVAIAGHEALRGLLLRPSKAPVPQQIVLSTG